MIRAGILCPKCKEVLWPKKVNVTYHCKCTYCYVHFIFRQGANHLRIGYGIPGARIAEVPRYVSVDTETGEIVEYL